MKKFQIDALDITLEKEGAQSFSKVSYPIRYGRFSEIRTPEYTFQFNRNNDKKIQSASGLYLSDPKVMTSKL